jgi:corrinoid protein of di/trimethylamine methyltransferase
MLEGYCMAESNILKGLADAVVAGDKDRAVSFANDALKAGIDPYRAIMGGCSKGMEVLSDLYDKGEAFVPEILVSADAMNAAIAILKPHIRVEGIKATGKIVLGVCEGDVHDIGKNIVKIMLDAAGFRVVDLGYSVSAKQFVEAVRKESPDIVGVSALMTMTMMGMQEIVEALRDSGLRDSVKVIVGGGPLSPEFAERIGADGFGDNGPEAVKLVEKLMAEKTAGKGA